jgi:hypothetical protein
MHRLAAVTSLVTLVALMASLRAEAKPPLAEVRALYEPLLAAAVGEAIVRECPGIAPRMLTVWRRAKALERQALAMGYTETELRAFRTSEAERARLKARRDAVLAARGVAKGDRAAHCRLGHAEIAAGSPVGALLQRR